MFTDALEEIFDKKIKYKYNENRVGAKLTLKKKR
jgi:hypothetical protein